MDSFPHLPRILSCVALGFSTLLLPAKEAVDYVDPMIGTFPGSSGSCFPGASVPFGMVKLAPLNGSGTNGYKPGSATYSGFTFTRFSGTGGTPGMGNLLIMPLSGDPEGRVGGWLDHPARKATETPKAESYALEFEDGTLAELAATSRTGLFRFSFAPGEERSVVVDAGFKLGGRSTRSSLTILDATTFEGWLLCSPTGGTRANATYRIYFRGEFSESATEARLWERAVAPLGNAPSYASPDDSALEADYTGARFSFGSGPEPVFLRMAISFVDMNGARQNFASEGFAFDFEETVQAARQAWSDLFSKFTVESDSEDLKTIFYTALYHVGLDPRDFTDVDGRFFGMDGSIHIADDYEYRTVFSGWDVYRSQFPLLTVLRPDVVVDQIKTLLHQGNFGSRGMPEWEFHSNYWNTMLGDPAVSVISDAYTKGIRAFDEEGALQLCLQNANGPKSSRDGWQQSKTLGYVPGNISATTENAYADWTIARLAEAMNRPEITADFDQRAGNWRNTFDSGVGWMRRKDANGNWQSWSGFSDSSGVRESTVLQQSFFVPHNVPGLMLAMGGRESFLDKIDILFQRMPDVSEEFPYGKPWGNYQTARYTHDNEPVHFLPFMFNAAGAPWLTQKWSNYIARKAYDTGPDGLVGNEDAGQMSAWFVLAASGLHPLAPGDGRWQITAPLFPRIEIALDPEFASGATFTVECENFSEENVYIQSATLNGAVHEKAYLTHEDLANGGVLELEMGPEPNVSWGVGGLDLYWITAALPEANEREPYEEQLHVGGGEPPHLFELAESVTLPQGISLSPDGLLQGRPDPGTAGDYPLSVKVTDANGAVITRSFDLKVNIYVDTQPSLVIPTLEAYPGTLLTRQLEVRGGNLPLQWEITELPNSVQAALSQDGELRMVASESGSPVLEVEVTDEDGDVGSADLPLTVLPFPDNLSALKDLTVKVRGENSEAGEGRMQALDGSSSSKWLDFNPTSWIEIMLPPGLIWEIENYAITSANDWEQRDPKDWSLFIRGSDGDWIPVDTRTGIDFPERFMRRAFSLGETTPANRAIRFEFANNSEEIFQVAEIELFGSLTLEEEWKRSMFIAGVDPENLQAENDANGNQIPLLLEYALGRKPEQGKGASAMRIEVEPFDGIPHLVIRYQRRTTLAGVRLDLEHSPDLSRWDPAGMTFSGYFEEVEENPDGTTESVKARVPLPLTSSFLRLHVLEN